MDKQSDLSQFSEGDSSQVDQYECGVCGRSFDSKRGRGGHMSQSHDEDKIKTELLDELLRLARQLDKSPTQEEMLNQGKFSFQPYMRTFGSWNEALQSAGLELNSRQEISEQELIDAIKQFSDELGHTPTHTEMEDTGPFSPGVYERVFGSWNEALRASGLDINVRQSISETELNHEVNRLAKELDRPPERREMDKYGRFSSSSYKSKFGSWNEALRAAELEPSNKVDISKSELRSALSQFAENLDHTPTSGEMDDDGPFSSNTYIREFGSWNEALRATDIDINKERNISTSELKSQINELAGMIGRPPSIAEMNNRGRYSAGPYLAEFGSWNEALRAAGLEIYQHRQIPHSKLQDGLQQLADEMNTTPTQMDMENRGPFSHNAYITQFGSWNEALRATDLEIQLTQNISESKLLDALQRLAEELGRPPMRTEMNSNGLFSVGPYIRRFGSWDEALVDAGLDPSNVPDGILRPDELDHCVRSEPEKQIAEILLDENIDYEYESMDIEYDENRIYVPDFITNDYVIEYKGADWGKVFNKEFTDEQKAREAMNQLDDRKYVVIGEELPSDEHIQWKDRDKLRDIF